jgi:hypothetical protein
MHRYKSYSSKNSKQLIFLKIDLSTNSILKILATGIQRTKRDTPAIKRIHCFNDTNRIHQIICSFTPQFNTSSKVRHYKRVIKIQ